MLNFNGHNVSANCSKAITSQLGETFGAVSVKMEDSLLNSVQFIYCSGLSYSITLSVQGTGITGLFPCDLPLHGGLIDYKECPEIFLVRSHDLAFKNDQLTVLTPGRLC